jgi:hypothetical protein
VDAVVERGPVAVKVQPEPGPLPLGPHPRVGSQIAGTRSRRDSSGEHPGVDPVGLTGKRGQAFDLLGVGDGDLEAGQLELVMHEAGAVHRPGSPLVPAVCGRRSGGPAHTARRHPVARR